MSVAIWISAVALTISLGSLTVSLPDIFVGPDGDHFEGLWVEDSHRRRHEAKNGRKNMMLLRAPGALTTR